MSAKILIIEDVKEMAELVSTYLEKDGFKTAQAGSAEEALAVLPSFSPNLVLLDLNLPGMGGFDFLKRFREENPAVPVIIVSARDADEDIIEGLGIGADEFVTKPFSPRVLAAKVGAALRRTSEVSAAAEDFKSFGDFKLLLNSCVLKKGVERIPLSAKEYKILEHFVRHEGEVLSPETIYAAVWNSSYGDITAVAVYVQRLRKKIEKNPAEPEFLLTEFGKGYRFTSKP